MDVKVRFLKKVVIEPNGCWGWVSSRDSKGRPQFYLDRKRQTARRAAWKIFQGDDLAADVYLENSCGSSECVNPEHIILCEHRSGSLLERIRRLVKVDENGCWIWQGGVSAFGYGKIQHRGKSRNAHRASWIAHKGEIPDGLHVCHKCDVPACCNPDHLFLGSPLDNMIDKIKKRRHNAPKGESHKDSKLKANQVYEIRSATGPQKEIARRFGVGPDVVSRIKSRKAWAHLPERAI